MTKETLPKEQSTKGLWITIAILGFLLASLISAGVGFYNGVHYAEGKMRQADARVEQAVAALKAPRQ